MTYIKKHQPISVPYVILEKLLMMMMMLLQSSGKIKYNLKITLRVVKF